MTIPELNNSPAPRKESLQPLNGKYDHPTIVDLSDFAEGKHRDAARIEKHLERCDHRCNEVVARYRSSVGKSLKDIGVLDS